MLEQQGLFISRTQKYVFYSSLQTLYGMQVQTRPEKIWVWSNKINNFYEYLNYEMTISRVVIVTYDNRYLVSY